MENKLEQLLNMLIQRGWKPFHQEIKDKWWVRWNYPCEWVIKIRKNTIFISYRYENRDEQITKRKKVQHSVRELVSKESELWQFVCENKMVFNSHYVRDWWIDNRYDKGIRASDYKFRLIESALKDESELEQFLLDNIKV